MGIEINNTKGFDESAYKWVDTTQVTFDSATYNYVYNIQADSLTISPKGEREKRGIKDMTLGELRELKSILASQLQRTLEDFPYPVSVEINTAQVFFECGKRVARYDVNIAYNDLDTY